jgi:HSP20 family protein
VLWTRLGTDRILLVSLAYGESGTIRKEERMPRNLARFNPLTELEALRKQFFGDDFLTPFQGANLPTTDVYTENDRLVVEAHLPNFDETDINVNLDAGALIIQAEKHEKIEDQGKKYMVRESSSSFYRRIALPEGADGNATNAQFENGVLRVVVPFRELPSPKRIAISTGGSSGSEQLASGGGATAGEGAPSDTGSQAPEGAKASEGPAAPSGS